MRWPLSKLPKDRENAFVSTATYHITARTAGFVEPQAVYWFAGFGHWVVYLYICQAHAWR